MQVEQVHFEIIENYHLPFKVTFGDKERMRQHIYMHNGGAFPVECVVEIEGPADSLAIGKYSLLPNAFKVGKYGSPEINNWSFRESLVPYKLIQNLNK